MASSNEPFRRVLFFLLLCASELSCGQTKSTTGNPLSVYFPSDVEILHSVIVPENEPSGQPVDRGQNVTRTAEIKSTTEVPSSVGTTETGSGIIVASSQPQRSSPKPEVNPINTKILLYTRRNPIVGHFLAAGDLESVKQATKYTPGQPVRIIVHGSFDGLDVGHWMRDMKTKFLDTENANVMVVDWSASASVSNWNQRLANTRIVGHQVARVLEDFIVSAPS
ncbi:Pancreatic lipase-related protein 2 [Halotydeus destructor]|nr:Pancreatic lipase-related protein 2 [Halotydeus destructor]